MYEHNYVSIWEFRSIKSQVIFFEVSIGAESTTISFQWLFNGFWWPALSGITDLDLLLGVCIVLAFLIYDSLPSVTFNIPVYSLTCLPLGFWSSSFQDHIIFWFWNKHKHQFTKVNISLWNTLLTGLIFHLLKFFILPCLSHLLVVVHDICDFVKVTKVSFVKGKL